MVYILFSIIFILFSSAQINAVEIPEHIFNSKLTQEERISLAEGKQLIRNINNAKNICLKTDTPAAKEITETFKKLNPAYLAETIQVIPADGRDPKAVIDNLYSSLISVSDYAGIPYYSVQNETYYDLYSSAEIKSKSINSNGDDVFIVELDMLPFGLIETEITISKTDDHVIYRTVNTDNILYSGIICIGKRKLISVIYAFQYKDAIVFYSIGGANAPSVFFLRKRIETSFLNRITTFAGFMSKKITEINQTEVK